MSNSKNLDVSDECESLEFSMESDFLPGFDDEDEDEDDEITDFEPLIGRRINFVNQQRRVSDLRNDWKEKLLDPDPDFQRKYIWKDERASLLIESILLNVPIPLIYTAEDEKTGVELVVDGQQRLKSLFRFLDNDLKLKGLKVFSELNDKTFEQLEQSYQRKILRYPLPVVTISADSDEDVKFEIFERINSGAVPLNAQEIRNCVYHGHYNEFIKQLAKDPLFLEIVYNNNEPDRMQNVEVILRFTAFYLEGYQAYSGRLKSFINEHLKKQRRFFKEISESERNKKFEDIRKEFRKSLELTRLIWGKNAFQTCFFNNKETKSLTWTGKVVFTLFDVVMYGFASYTKPQIIPKIDSIRESLINLILNDPRFMTKGGGFHKGMLKYRFNRWVGELQSIVDSPSHPRGFSYRLKEELFVEDPTCSICGQRIRELDDSEVDHHIPYWKGGATIPENARLTHRFCNRAKGSR